MDTNLLDQAKSFFESGYGILIVWGVLLAFNPLKRIDSLFNMMGRISTYRRGTRHTHHPYP
jgi:hypothetical protein